jgi:excisionase family DNA binding protein
MEDQFVDSATVAKYLGLAPRTVAKMAREGRIPAHPISGLARRTWVFSLAEIKDFVMLSQRPGASAESE